MSKLPVSSGKIYEAFESDGLFTEKIGEDRKVKGVSPADTSAEGDLTFADKEKFLEIARERKPAVVILNAKLKDKLKPEDEFQVFLCKNVALAHSWIRQKYADVQFNDTKQWGQVHKSAVVHEKAKIHKDAVIGPNTVIGKGTKIGKGTVIMAGAVVEHDVEIGQNTVIHSNVVVGYGSKIGNNVIIRAGTTIGSEGFGFAQDEKRKNHRIPQLGIVVIEDDVVLGSNNCIDRATYGETRIKSGTVSDNFCHVAHNVEIGENCILVAMTGIAGSTTLGDRVICGGQTGIQDHIDIPADTILLGRAAVLSDSIKESGVYGGGPPLLPYAQFQKNTVHLKNLDRIVKDFREMKKKVDKLESGQST